MELNGRRVAVTGATGLIGSALVPRLEAAGARVVCLTRSDLAAPERALGGADLVVHLAAQTVVAHARRDPLATFVINVGATWRVVAAARDAGAQRVLLASSDQVYGPAAPVPRHEDLPLRPRGPYAASKAAAEVVAQGLTGGAGEPALTVVRLSNVYGPGDRMITRLVPGTVGAVLAGRRPVIRGDGSAERDLLYVDDAVDALLALVAAEADGTFNVGSGRPVSVGEVVEHVLRLAGSALRPRVLGETPPEEGGRQAVGIERIAEAVGWRPTVDLEEGLRRTIAWQRGAAAAA